MAILATIAHAGKNGYEVSNPHWLISGVVHWSRNNAIAELPDNYDWVLFVDDDMLPERDALYRLLQHNEPIVSALTTSREIPPRLNVKAYSHEEDRFVVIDKVKPDTLVRGDIGVGTGFLLLRRDAVEAAIKSHLEARDWVEDMQPMLQRTGVHPDRIEEERARRSKIRKDLAKSGYVKPQVFDFLTMDNGHTMGEDISFCRRMLRDGWKVAVDTGVQVGHCGDFPYGPWNMTDRDSKKMAL